MRSPEKIIKRPLLTEKGTRLKETGGSSGDLDPEAIKQIEKRIIAEPAA